MTEPKTAKDALDIKAEIVKNALGITGHIPNDVGYVLDYLEAEGLFDRAQPEQAPADVKELIRKYQHEVDYLEQIERTEFGDDSLSTYSIFLKELKGLSSRPPAVAGDDLRVAELTSVLIDLNNTRHAQNAIYKFVPDTLDQLFNKYEGKYGMTYFTMTQPPAMPPKEGVSHD